MSDDGINLSDPVVRREFRDRNLKILAAQSNSDEFKKVVDDVINGRTSLFAASMSGAFAETMSELVTKAVEENPDPAAAQETAQPEAPAPRAQPAVRTPDPRALPVQESPPMYRPPEVPKPSVPPSRSSFDPDDFWAAGKEP